MEILFFDSVTGTDGKGISHMYEDFVEFRMGEYPTDRGYAVLSCTFSTIPLGRYTVSEKKTLRYVFESITAQTANVSLNDRTGTVTLDKNNKKQQLHLQIKRQNMTGIVQMLYAIKSVSGTETDRRKYRENGLQNRRLLDIITHRGMA